MCIYGMEQPLYRIDTRDLFLKLDETSSKYRFFNGVSVDPICEHGFELKELDSLDHPVPCHLCNKEFQPQGKEDEEFKELFWISGVLDFIRAGEKKKRKIAEKEKGEEEENDNDKNKREIPGITDKYTRLVAFQMLFRYLSVPTKENKGIVAKLSQTYKGMYLWLSSYQPMQMMQKEAMDIEKPIQYYEFLQQNWFADTADNLDRFIESVEIQAYHWGGWKWWYKRFSTYYQQVYLQIPMEMNMNGFSLTLDQKGFYPKEDKLLIIDGSKLRKESVNLNILRVKEMNVPFSKSFMLLITNAKRFTGFYCQIYLPFIPNEKGDMSYLMGNLSRDMDLMNLKFYCSKHMQPNIPSSLKSFVKLKVLSISYLLEALPHPMLPQRIPTNHIGTNLQVFDMINLEGPFNLAGMCNNNIRCGFLDINFSIPGQTEGLNGGYLPSSFFSIYEKGFTSSLSLLDLNSDSFNQLENLFRINEVTYFPELRIKEIHINGKRAKVMPEWLKNVKFGLLFLVIKKFDDVPQWIFTDVEAKNLVLTIEDFSNPMGLNYKKVSPKSEKIYCITNEEGEAEAKNLLPSRTVIISDESAFETATSNTINEFYYIAKSKLKAEPIDKEKPFGDWTIYAIGEFTIDIFREFYGERKDYSKYLIPYKIFPIQ